MITTRYNPDTHKLVPLMPTRDMNNAGEYGRQHENALADEIYASMLSAAPTPPQPEDGDCRGSGVKALMWVHDSNADDWSASTVVGLYAVGWVHRQFVCILRHVGTGDNGGATDTRIASGSALEEAKVAAQADYERRIRSALTTEPAKAVACERCQGNGEIITDWDRYRSPKDGDKGDEVVAECPDCSGSGTVSSVGIEDAARTLYFAFKDASELPSDVFKHAGEGNFFTALRLLFDPLCDPRKPAAKNPEQGSLPETELLKLARTTIPYREGTFYFSNEMDRDRFIDLAVPFVERSALPVATPPSPSADLREALEAATVRARYLLDRGADDLGIGEVDSFIRMVALIAKQEGGS